MNTIAVMQPYFFPYLGYYQLVKSVDHFVFFDEVQYQRKGWMGRNRLLNLETNEPFYIRPGLIKPAYKSSLKDVKLEENGDWKDVLFSQLAMYKRKAPFYEEVRALLELIISDSIEYLVDLNIYSIIRISEYLGVATTFARYSAYDFTFDRQVGKDDWGRVVSKELGAKKYVNAPGGAAFIFPDKFIEDGISLGFIQPELKEYRQGTTRFIGGLSILDVLLFNGREKTNNLLDDYTISWKN